MSANKRLFEGGSLGGSGIRKRKGSINDKGSRGNRNLYIVGALIAVA